MIKPTFLAASLLTLAALAACGDSAETIAPTETADATAVDAASTDEVIVPADADAAAADAAVAAARADKPRD